MFTRANTARFILCRREYSPELRAAACNAVVQGRAVTTQDLEQEDDPAAQDAAFGDKISALYQLFSKQETYFELKHENLDPGDPDIKVRQQVINCD